ncbi:MAG: heavy metal translocating P-type ATPase [Cyanobacteria bacterium]|nr:heavy metal translocating P-type ATPase [Cyanobacteriota bacterium]
MVEILHQIPGRVRVRVPHLRGNAQLGLRLEAALGAMPEILAVRVNGAAESLTLRYRPSQGAAVLARLADLWAGLDGSPESLRAGGLAIAAPALVKESGDRDHHGHDDHDHDQDHDNPWVSLQRPLLAVALAATSQWSPLRWLRPLAGLTVVSLVLPIAQRAVRSLWYDHRLSIDSLDFLAISLSASQGNLLTPALVITLHELGDTIRNQTARSTAVRSASLTDALGHFAWIKTGETGDVLTQVPSDQVPVGAIVVVHPGEQIPVDGTVLDGEATVDQQGLTGEAMPIVARSRDYVFAATLVRSGQLTLRAERVGDQTRAGAGLQLLQDAPVYDTRMANYTEKVADRVILPLLLLAGAVLLVTRDPARAAAILTLDLVTGVRVSIPTAFLGALNHTTRHGLLVRSGRTLEQLAEIDTILFDKTGTLTEGHIELVAITPVRADLSADQLLLWAATAEQRLTHPVADAIAQAAQARGLVPLERGDWDYAVGYGVTAQVAGHRVQVGSERFLRQAQVQWPETPLDLAADLAHLYVAFDGELVGTLSYADPLRPDSGRLLQLLQDTFQLDVYLLTGDTPERAARVADALGIAPERVYAEAFPDQKAKIVQNLRRSGRTVAFVGDGLNDSVALAYADVSISFERGAEVARETAEVVLMDNDLLELLEAIAIARETRDLIEQNIALVVLPNLIALGFASTTGLSPLLATLIHNGSAIAAGLNSLRPLVTHGFAPNSVIDGD